MRAVRRFGHPASTRPPTSRAPSRSRSRTRASPASSAWRRAARSTSRCCSAAGTSSSTSTGTRNDSYLARAVEGFFLNGGSSCYVVRIAHRAKPARRQGAGARARRRAPSGVVKDGWDKPTLRVRALNEGRWGNNIWVRFQQTTAAQDAAHARPRGRRRRGARQQRQGLRARRAGAHLRSRELGLHRRHRGRRPHHPLGVGDADRAPLPRRRPDLPRGARVRGLSRRCKDRREVVPRPAAVAAVAPLRAAGHQRRVAADPDRGSALGGAAAAQPAAGRAGGEADRRPRRHRGADRRGLRRPRSRPGRSHRADGARRRRAGGDARRCPTPCSRTSARRGRRPTATCSASRTR